MYAHIQTGEKGAIIARKIAAANQNVPQKFNTHAPQWYDVKFLVERMFDLRGMVRDGVARRREAETMRRRFVGHPSSQIMIAEIHGHNMDIALAWHDYRNAVAAYHMAWGTYRKNLRRF
jgi:hypothetical protein